MGGTIYTFRSIAKRASRVIVYMICLACNWTDFFIKKGAKIYRGDAQVVVVVSRTIRSSQL
jgi:hypothetical protein